MEIVTKFHNYRSPYERNPGDLLISRSNMLFISVESSEESDHLKAMLLIFVRTDRKNCCAYIERISPSSASLGLVMIDRADC